MIYQAPRLNVFTPTAKRYIPILPALPNGIKDALPEPRLPVRIHPRGQGDTVPTLFASPFGLNSLPVATLLNPCNCKDVWTCKCRKKDNLSVPSVTANTNGVSGLVALADAAVLHRGNEQSNGQVQTIPETASLPPSLPETLPVQPRPSRCCQSPAHTEDVAPARSLTRGPLLPPIIDMVTASHDLSNGPPPTFPEIPPLDLVVSIAGSGCTCGFNCTCPGCVVHRGAKHASKDLKDCSEGCCNTCVDNESGVELPSRTSEPRAPSFIDTFFARAAIAIPPPPSHRAPVAKLDPTNVTVYPSSLFEGTGRVLEERGAAFGLVQLPKLECCAGRCSCPSGSCGCAASCDGCGQTHDGAGESCCATSCEGNEGATVPTPPVQISSKSCCR